MSVSFLQIGEIAGNPGFQKRVSYALSVAAVAIMNEAADVPNHNPRVSFAKRVLALDFQPYETAFLVLTNPTIVLAADVSVPPDYNITDADIQFQVNSLFNALAGVSN